MTASRRTGPGRVGRSVAATTLLLLFLVCGGCDTLVPPPAPNTPTGNFEALWTEFDARYALFAVRAVDWDSLGAALAPRVHDDMSPQDLFAVMSDLLAPLRDPHVSLQAPGVGSFYSGYVAGAPYFPDGRAGDYTYELARQRYVVMSYLDRQSGGYATRDFAAIAPGRAGGRRLLYLELEVLRDNGAVNWARVDSCLEAGPDCDGLIVDLRAGAGGSFELAEHVLDGMAESPRVIGTWRSRNGPGHQDFGPPVEWVVTPAGTGWGTVPLVVLTDPSTASASEWLALGLSYRDQTTVIGTRTMGIFSARADYLLPNGWRFTCSGDLMADAEGNCLEALGVPADLEVRNTAAANRAGHDLALDAALALLGGTPAP